MLKPIPAFHIPVGIPAFHNTLTNMHKTKKLAFLVHEKCSIC